MNEYQRLCSIDSQGRPINKGTWIPYGSNPFNKINSVDDTYYLSAYIYNDKHLEQFKKTNSIAAMEDLTADHLYWDFDSKDNLDQARAETEEMCSRLISHGVPSESILACFSGMKGFSVEVRVSKRLKPEEVKAIASKMAEGLDTFDSSIYDAARIFRVPNTKHQKSGLYKTPLVLEDLSQPIKNITALCQQKPEKTWIEMPVVELPSSILELKRTDTKDRVLKATIVDAVDLDFKHKPRGFSNCRFAILNGFFPDGQRSNSLMALTATCKANHFPKEVAYNMAKAASRLQSQRYGKESFSKEEIWTNVIEQIYGDGWTGGQYTCKSPGPLQDICNSLGSNKCKHLEDVVVTTDAVFDMFKSYAINYDKNVLTTGIGPLDKNIKFLMGTSNGILASPGVGKTSMSLSILQCFT
jgi:hypothetical protein